MSRPTGSHLYVVANQSVRVIDAETQLIDEWEYSPTYTSTTGCNNPLVLWGYDLALALSNSGAMFVAGCLCGQQLPGFVHGVARIDTDGSVHWIAGDAGGSPADNVPADQHLFGPIRGLFLDQGDNLFVLDGGNHALKRIDATSGVLTFAWGSQGVSGGSGDYGPAEDALTHSPTEVAYAAGIDGVILRDNGNVSFREAWALSDHAVSTLTMNKVIGDAQTGVVATSYYAPLGVSLTDAGGAEVSGLGVEWTSLHDGTTPQFAVAPTNPPSNNSITNGFVPLLAQDYQFEAAYYDIHGAHVTDSPQTFTVSSVEPPPGTLLTLINKDYAAAPITPGPSIVSPAHNCAAAVEGPSGSVYAACGNQILHISADLVVSLVAGAANNAGGYAGDAGPASGATFTWPRDLVYDATRQRLYIASQGNHVVRMIDFSQPVPQISTIAGGAISTAPTWGDGGVATQAQLKSPAHLALSPDGDTLYIGTLDTHIRRVDMVTGVIDTVIDYDSGEQCGDAALFLWDCSVQSCSVAVDPVSGDLYIGARFCGTAITSASTDDTVVRYDVLSGSFT